MNSDVVHAPEYKQLIGTCFDGKDILHDDCDNTRHVFVSPNGMNVPTEITRGHLFQDDSFLEAVKAFDNSDVMGAENCMACYWLFFEVHTINSTASPPLDTANPERTKLASGADFAWLDITATPE